MAVRTLAALTLFALAAAGCSTIADLPDEQIGSAALMLANGQPAGTARIVASGDRVMLTAGVTGVAPGVHGIHLHTTGQCAGPDFASAGGHLNPLGRHHGSLTTSGPHVGDLPNVTVSANGNGVVRADLPGTPAEVRNWLFDTDGAAIVVHADPDDYKTDPSGNSGARLACGIVKPG